MYNDILTEVCSFYKIQESDLFKNTREKEICLPRQVFFHLCVFRNIQNNVKQKGHDKDYKSIQDFVFDCSDKWYVHATIKHAFHKIANQIMLYKDFKNDIFKIKSKLNKNYNVISLVPTNINLIGGTIKFR